MPGLQRPEELTRLGLELMAIEAGASPGDVPTVGSGGSVTYQPAGGASFPDEWTVNPTTGSMTIDQQAGDGLSTPLLLIGSSSQATDLFQIRKGDSFAFGVGAAGDLYLIATDSAVSPLTIYMHETQSLEALTVRDSGGTDLFGVNKGGYWYTKVTSAPADGDLVAGQMMLWFDQTNGAAKLMVKAKQANGTVRTGSVSLT